MISPIRARRTSSWTAWTWKPEQPAQEALTPSGRRPHRRPASDGGSLFPVFCSSTAATASLPGPLIFDPAAGALSVSDAARALSGGALRQQDTYSNSSILSGNLRTARPAGGFRGLGPPKHADPAPSPLSAGARARTGTSARREDARKADAGRIAPVRPSEVVIQSSITTRVRTSMLSRGGAPAGVSGRSKAPCGVKRARPSARLSQPLISRTSSGVMRGA